MKRTMTPRESRLVALLILVAAIALVIVTIVYPIADGFAERAAERERLALQYKLNQRLIASIPRLRRAAEEQKSTLGRFTLSGMSPNAAAELLQERVGSAVEGAGGEIRSVENTAERDTVHVRIAASTTLEQMLRAIARIQDAQPYATIDSLTVSADQALISGRPDVMDVTLDVSIPYLAR